MGKGRRIEKEQRQIIIKDFLLSRKIYNQSEVMEYLKSNGIEISQSTISRDMDELGFEESDDDGHFVENNDSIFGKNKKALYNLMKNIYCHIYKPKLLAGDPEYFKSKIQDAVEETESDSMESDEQEQNKKKFFNIYCVIIKITPGYEHAINDFITNIYKERIIGTFVGFQCVFIICSKTESKRIVAELKKLKNREHLF